MEPTKSAMDQDRRPMAGSGAELVGGALAAGGRARVAFAKRRIAYVKVGRHVRIAEDDLVSFVAAGRIGASA